MFVKQIVQAAVDALGCSIEHDSEQLYSGNIKSAPFYLLDEKVLTIAIFGTNLVITI